jgi:hypothetical protein
VSVPSNSFSGSVLFFPLLLSFNELNSSFSQTANTVIIVDKVQANPLDVTNANGAHAAWLAEYVSPSPFLPFLDLRFPAYTTFPRQQDLTTNTVRALGVVTNR